jgi:hypothetical protein
MSDTNDPGPEVRKKIVDGIMKHVEAKAPKDSVEQAELDELFKVKHDARNAVMRFMAPIVENAKMLPTTDPRYLHCEKGRAILLVQFQRAYLEQLRTLNREEAIFLLALAWSEFSLNEFV